MIEKIPEELIDDTEWPYNRGFKKVNEVIEYVEKLQTRITNLECDISVMQERIEDIES